MDPHLLDSCGIENALKSPKCVLIPSLLLHYTIGVLSWVLLLPVLSRKWQVEGWLIPSDYERDTAQDKYKYAAFAVLPVILALFAPVQGDLIVFLLVVCSALITLPVMTSMGQISYAGLDKGEFPWFIQLTVALSVICMLFACGALHYLVHGRADIVMRGLKAKLLEICMVIGILVVFECAMYGNIDMDNLVEGKVEQGGIHVHHWQFGAIFACVAAVMPERGPKRASGALAALLNAVCLIFRGILVGVIWHGVFSYAPDSTNVQYGFFMFVFIVEIVLWCGLWRWELAFKD